MVTLNLIDSNKTLTPPSPSSRAQSNTLSPISLVVNPPPHVAIFSRNLLHSIHHPHTAISHAQPIISSVTISHASAHIHPNLQVDIGPEITIKLYKLKKLDFVSDRMFVSLVYNHVLGEFNNLNNFNFFPLLCVRFQCGLISMTTHIKKKKH